MADGKLTTEQAMRQALEGIAHIPAPSAVMVSQFSALPENVKPYAKAVSDAVKIAKETLQLVDAGGFDGESGEVAGVDSPFGIVVGHNDSHVMVNFTQHVSTFGIGAGDAINFARELARNAAMLDQESAIESMQRDREGAGDGGSEGSTEKEIEA